VAEACALLARGDADLVLAGGAEAAVTPMGVGGFAAMRALSTRDVDPARASCPFDERRDGFVVGEGAGVLVLEREHDARRRGGRILALVTGSASTSDAWDPTQPDPEGHGALRAMRTALEDAGRDPGDVGWINAHATSTPLGDRAEALAIRRLVGDGPVPVSSTKGATGHLLGAAGAVEAAFTALALAEGRIPATTNLERPDPDCDLDLVAGAPREADLGCAITNAFGFGGTNVTLVMERGDGT